MNKVAFCTLGCKVNQYETNAMMQKMIEVGFEIVNFEEKADVYIINTCTVTNMADKKSRQMLRRVKEINPDSILVVVGCYAQVAKEKLEQIPEIDLILGTNEKNDIVTYIQTILQNKATIKISQSTEKYNKNKETTGNMQIKEEGSKEDKPIKEGELKQNNCISQISDVTSQKEFLDFGNVTYTEKTRAVIKVQDGCNQFCSYCIIPYARGRIRSRKPESVIQEITAISQKGVKEVVITGIHIASYGKDFDNSSSVSIFHSENNDLETTKNLQSESATNQTSNQISQKEKEDKDRLIDLLEDKSKYRLIDLLEEIQKIDGIERIRLGSLEPTLITEEFVQRLSKLSKICDQFHLSLQSGCDETLKRMNRKYTTKEFEKGVILLRKLFPQVHLTTDVIVGFPGETEEEFRQTYEFLKKIKFYKMHIFKYSPRTGTVAASMKNQIDGNKKEERSNLLLELSDCLEKEYNRQYIGKKVDVLFEEREGEYWKGHTTNYMVVKAISKDNLENKIKQVNINGLSGMELIGKLP